MTQGATQTSRVGHLWCNTLKFRGIVQRTGQIIQTQALDIGAIRKFSYKTCTDTSLHKGIVKEKAIFFKTHFA